MSNLNNSGRFTALSVLLYSVIITVTLLYFYFKPTLETSTKSITPTPVRKALAVPIVANKAAAPSHMSKPLAMTHNNTAPANDEIPSASDRQFNDAAKQEHKEPLQSKDEVNNQGIELGQLSITWQNSQVIQTLLQSKMISIGLELTLADNSRSNFVYTDYRAGFIPTQLNAVLTKNGRETRLIRNMGISIGALDVVRKKRVHTHYVRHRNTIIFSNTLNALLIDQQQRLLDLPAIKNTINNIKNDDLILNCIIKFIDQQLYIEFYSVQINGALQAVEQRIKINVI